MRKLNLLFPLFFLLLSLPVLAQREDTGNYEYDREYLLGINKNTNGGMIGGFAVKVGSRIDDSWKFTRLNLHDNATLCIE
jgi:hypothetical protein